MLNSLRKDNAAFKIKLDCVSKDQSKRKKVKTPDANVSVYQTGKKLLEIHCQRAIFLLVSTHYLYLFQASC